MKKFLLFTFTLVCTATALTAETFPWPTDLKYDFMPKCKMEFVNGVVRNTDAKALPDIEAKYSRVVRVDGRTFKLPGEICEATSACYKTDFNGDGVTDYLFVSVKVWNGRFTGRSDVGVYVSRGKGKFSFTGLEVQELGAVMEGKTPMLVTCDYCADTVNMIRTTYKFDAEGMIRLHGAEPFFSN